MVGPMGVGVQRGGVGSAFFPAHTRFLPSPHLHVSHAGRGYASSLMVKLVVKDLRSSLFTSFCPIYTRLEGQEQILPKKPYSMHQMARKDNRLGKRKKVRNSIGPPKPCPSTSKKTGGPCQAYVAVVNIRGKKYQLKTCVWHAPPAIRKELGIHSGRKPTPRADDILRARFEADADRYLQALEDGLTAMKAVVVGNGGSAHIEEVPDFALRLKAMETLLDRVYGRPKQVTELSGRDGAPVEIKVPDDKDRELEVAKVLAEVGAVGGAIVVPQAAPSPDEASQN